MELIRTKQKLFQYLKAHDTLDADQLSPELIQWLDLEYQDGVELMYFDGSGQGGSTIWTKQITLNGYKFQLDYITFGGSIAGEPESVRFKVTRVAEIDNAEKLSRAILINPIVNTIRISSNMLCWIECNSRIVSQGLTGVNNWQGTLQFADRTVQVSFTTYGNLNLEESPSRQLRFS